MTTPELVANKFRLQRLLGRGGMGEVHLALDETLGARRVALKLLRMDDEEVRKRFAQEARAAANLQHRHIVTVYEYGEHDGRPYLAMELVSGATLSEVIAEKRPLSLATRLELIEQACAGLSHAHAQGVIHRDIKPSNLIIDHEGRLRILDFGIAHVPASQLTRAPAMMGTPNYMSPEQINGEPLDRRSDVFSLGLVLYELLAHRQAFPGESMSVLDRLRFEPAPTLTLSPPGELSAAVVAVVDRAMAKRPEERYQDLLEMQRDLRHARGGTETRWWNVHTSETVLVRPPTRGTPGSGGSLPERRREMADRRVSLGKDALERHEYRLAVEEFEQAVALDETHPNAAALLAHARERRAGHQADEIKRLVAEAERQFAHGDLAAARLRINEAQALNAEHPHVIELAETIALAEVEARLERYRERARTALDTGDLSRAAALLDEAGQIRPDAPEIVTLRQQLDDAYAARARERRLQRLVAQGREHLERHELAPARQAAEQALMEDPEYLPARALRAEALAVRGGATEPAPELGETRVFAVDAVDDHDTRPILVSELQAYAREVMREASSSLQAADAAPGAPRWRQWFGRVVGARSRAGAGERGPVSRS